MPVTDWTETVQTWFQTHLHAGFDLSRVGLLALGVLAILLVFGVLQGVFGLIQRVRDAQISRRLRKDPSPGYRVLLAKPTGGGAGKLSKWLTASLNEHLGAFNFGAPFTIARTRALRGGTQPSALKTARARMQAADADMIVWATRLGHQRDGLVIHSLSRGGGLSVNEAKTHSFALPGKMSALRGQVPQLAAYALAKQLQPALTNPQAFRPEKMLELSEALEAMLGDCVDITPVLRDELEADFCASAVHGAAETGDLETLDRVIAMRRGHLDAVDQNTPPMVILQARMDLGRALLARADNAFDPAVIEEAMGHLSKVVESLQSDPTIQRAQTASDAMFKAQAMTESRKRFSVNFGT